MSGNRVNSKLLFTIKKVMMLQKFNLRAVKRTHHMWRSGNSADPDDKIIAFSNLRNNQLIKGSFHIKMHNSFSTPEINIVRSQIKKKNLIQRVVQNNQRPPKSEIIPILHSTGHASEVYYSTNILWIPRIFTFWEKFFLLLLKFQNSIALSRGLPRTSEDKSWKNR